MKVAIVQETVDLVRQGGQLVEVLPKPEYDDWHIQGAISIPLRQLDKEAPEKLRKDLPVIVYCYDYQ